MSNNDGAEGAAAVNPVGVQDAGAILIKGSQVVLHLRHRAVDGAAGPDLAAVPTRQPRHVGLFQLDDVQGAVTAQQWDIEYGTRGEVADAKLSEVGTAEHPVIPA